MSPAHGGPQNLRFRIGIFDRAYSADGRNDPMSVGGCAPAPQPSGRLRQVSIRFTEPFQLPKNEAEHPPRRQDRLTFFMRMDKVKVLQYHKRICFAAVKNRRN